jgi:hypothetical protein
VEQPSFFDKESGEGVDAEQLVLDAFGDFQARGHLLAERELPLDRLRGALRRAAERRGVSELGDEQAAAAMSALGVRVRRVPSFVAKHPYRVTVPAELAERARSAAAGRTEKSET